MRSIESIKLQDNSITNLVLDPKPERSGDSGRRVSYQTAIIDRGFCRSFCESVRDRTSSLKLIFNLPIIWNHQISFFRRLFFQGEGTK